LPSRVTVSPRNTLGTGNDAAHDFFTKVTCTNNQGIIVERPMCFNYQLIPTTFGTVLLLGWVLIIPGTIGRYL